MHNMIISGRNCVAERGWQRERETG